MSNDVQQPDRRADRFRALVQSVDSILGDLPAEASRFLAIYARFEYALMKRPQKNDSSRTYAADQRDQLVILYGNYVNEVISEDFFNRVKDLTLEGYLVQEPPKLRTVANGWSDPDPVTDNRSLFKAVKQVRNNLFHGNKFRVLIEGDRERDVRLINAASSILLKAVSEDDLLYQDFYY